MPRPPEPGPFDVNVHTGPAEWWQFLAALGPLAVLAAAMIAGWIAWKALRQKTAADSRSEWWRRAEWAFDSILSQEPRRAQVGLQVMTVLAESTPSPEEVQITTVAWGNPLEEAAELSALEDTSPMLTAPPGSAFCLDDMLDRNSETGRMNRQLPRTDKRLALTAEPMRTPATDRAGRSAPLRVDRGAAARDRGVQIAAAQLRLVTDRRLGQVTPEWIKQLAAERPPLGS